MDSSKYEIISLIETTLFHVKMETNAKRAVLHTFQAALKISLQGNILFGLQYFVNHVSVHDGFIIVTTAACAQVFRVKKLLHRVPTALS